MQWPLHALLVLSYMARAPPPSAERPTAEGASIAVAAFLAGPCRKPLNAKLSVVWHVAGDVLNFAQAGAREEQRGTFRLPLALCHQPLKGGQRQRLSAFAREVEEACGDEV